MDTFHNVGSEKREIPFRFAIIPLVAMIVAMIITIVVLEGDPHSPLILGTMIAAFIAWRFGYSWKELETGLYDGIRLALPAVVIIMMVGLIIATWIGGGIVATMIYYGLMLITPSLFLVTICILCCIVSLAIGGSWSTMGTVGVAGMGIAVSMGIPLPMAAGAIISGAYFGDKMSPLSDTTNLASGLSGSDLFEHIRHMLYTTIPGLTAALIAYWIMGMQFTSDTVNLNDIQTVMGALQNNFLISPWLLLVPAVVIALIVKKVPAIPALAVGILLGFLCHIVVQGGSVADAVVALQSGYVIESGNETVDSLFNRGGIDSMMYTVSLTIVAMTFGGIMEETGMLNTLVKQIVKLAKTPGKLVGTTVLSSFATNVACAEQYISLVVPSRMYAQAYKNQNLHPKNLSRALEDGGTLTSVFVPWNTCGVFILGTLGVHAFEYAPYAILNFSVPIIALIFAAFGLFMPKLTEGKLSDQVQTPSSST